MTASSSPFTRRFDSVSMRKWCSASDEEIPRSAGTSADNSRNAMALKSEPGTDLPHAWRLHSQGDVGDQIPLTAQPSSTVRQGFPGDAQRDPTTRFSKSDALQLPVNKGPVLKQQPLVEQERVVLQVELDALPLGLPEQSPMSHVLLPSNALQFMEVDRSPPPWASHRRTQARSSAIQGPTAVLGNWPPRRCLAHTLFVSHRCKHEAHSFDVPYECI